MLGCSGRGARRAGPRGQAQRGREKAPSAKTKKKPTSKHRSDIFYIKGKQKTQGAGEARPRGSRPDPQRTLAALRQAKPPAPRGAPARQQLSRPRGAASRRGTRQQGWGSSRSLSPFLRRLQPEQRRDAGTELPCALAGLARRLRSPLGQRFQRRLGPAASRGGHVGDVLGREGLDDVAGAGDDAGSGQLLEGALRVPRGAHGRPDALLELLVPLEGEGQLADLRGHGAAGSPHSEPAQHPSCSRHPVPAAMPAACLRLQSCPAECLAHPLSQQSLDRRHSRHQSSPASPCSLPCCAGLGAVGAGRDGGPGTRTLRAGVAGRVRARVAVPT